MAKTKKHSTGHQNIIPPQKVIKLEEAELDNLRAMYAELNIINKELGLRVRVFEKNERIYEKIKHSLVDKGNRIEDQLNLSRELLQKRHAIIGKYEIDLDKGIIKIGG